MWGHQFFGILKYAITNYTVQNELITNKLWHNEVFPYGTGGKNWVTVSIACCKRRLKGVAAGRASSIKTLPKFMKCAPIKLSYQIGRGSGQQWLLPVTGHQGLLMDMLLGSILVKCEDMGIVGGRRKRGRREERI